MIQLTNLYRTILNQHKNINISIDMTCGNGHDTLFLSDISKKVYSFDIQEKAINQAKTLLQDRNNVTFINDNHSNIKNHVNETIDVAIYNLGYLPGGDKSIATSAKSTVESLKSLLSILNDLGIIIIEVYPHNEEEKHLVNEFTSQLNNDYDVIRVDLHNKLDPPYLIIIHKALKK